jgi:hypothetical protein
MTQVPPAVITPLSGWQMRWLGGRQLGPIPSMTDMIYFSLVIVFLPFPSLLFHSHHFSIFRTLHRQLPHCS